MSQSSSTRIIAAFLFLLAGASLRTARAQEKGGEGETGPYDVVWAGRNHSGTRVGPGALRAAFSPKRQTESLFSSAANYRFLRRLRRVIRVAMVRSGRRRRPGNPDSRTASSSLTATAS